MNPYANNENSNENGNNDNNTIDTVSTESLSYDSFDTEFSQEDYNYYYNDNFQINLSNNHLNKNILLIPEIYNKYFHGKTYDSDTNIDGQFLVLQTFYINSDNNICDFFKYVNNLCKFYKKYYEKKISGIHLPHVLLRNYFNIIKHPSYLNLQIGQIYYLTGNECVCVIKTIWLKLIQRAWKKVYKIRKEINHLRCRPDSILHRQFCGKWPQNCNYLPSIRGMLL
jgi:hypothetical protein